MQLIPEDYHLIPIFIVIIAFSGGLVKTGFLFYEERELHKKNWRIFIGRVLYQFRMIKYSSVKALKEGLFFDFKIILIFFVLLLTAILLYFPHQNYFSLPSIGTRIYIIDRLLRTSAIFIGIIISLIILSFQVFNRSFGRFAFLVFFHNKYLKSLFTLYVINILFSIYALSYLLENQKDSNYSKVIFLLCIILNLLLLLLLFPISAQMLKKSQSRFQISNIIGLIEENWILSLTCDKLSNSENLETIENNPITMLKEVAFIALESNDNTTVGLIINGLFSHLKGIIEKHDGKEITFNNYFYNEYQYLVNSIMPYALQSDNYYLVNDLIYARNDLEEYILTNRTPNSIWSKTFDYNAVEISLDYDEYFTKAIAQNNLKLGERILSGYYAYCKFLVEIYLPTLFTEDQFGNYEKYIAEKMMSLNLFSRKPDQFTDYILAKNRLNLFTKIFNFFSLEGVVIASDNLKPVKVYLLNVLKGSKEAIFKKYLDTNVQEITFLNFPYSGLSLYSEIEVLHNQAIFNSLKRAMNLAYDRRKLNNRIINELKATGMHFISKWAEEGFYKKLLIQVVDQFDYLRSIISEEADNYQKDIYIKLHRYLGYVQGDFAESGIEDQEVEDYFNSTLQNFPLAHNYTQELDKSGYIMNNNVI